VAGATAHKLELRKVLECLDEVESWPAITRLRLKLMQIATSVKKIQKKLLSCIRVELHDSAGMHECQSC
jgi:hypothetical protein